MDVSSRLAMAAAAVSSGDLRSAQTHWRAVLEVAPDQADALFGMAFSAIRRGAPEDALSFADALARVRPGDPAPALFRAQAFKALGRLQDEAGALAEALATDAYCWPALLQLGQLHERTGRLKDAAETYRNVLKIAPPREMRPADSAAALDHAERLAAQYAEAMEFTLVESLGEVGAANDGRWREAAAVMAGRVRPYTSSCNNLYVPRLPAVPFYDRALFAWAEAFEARTDDIRAEMLRVLSTRADRFEAYIQYQPGEPVNQWAALNHSKDWSTFHLYRDGAPVADNLSLCPATAEALSLVELADMPDFCPNVMFSVLAPHTQIPPHHGETNARLVAHLPLVVPKNCHYRVGFEHRSWREGELLIFDDSIEHTARNDSDEPRVVLIFDVWNPHLSIADREIVRRLLAAWRAFKS